MVFISLFTSFCCSSWHSGFLSQRRFSCFSLWHAFLFLGLRFTPLFFSFCLVALTVFSCKKLVECLYPYCNTRTLCYETVAIRQTGPANSRYYRSSSSTKRILKACSITYSGYYVVVVGCESAILIACFLNSQRTRRFHPDYSSSLETVDEQD
jgi:hypothetical protein